MTGRRFKIAVVVVARNAEATIAEAMESIVTQDYEDFQLVFFDDCSSDSTLEIAVRFRDRSVFTEGRAPQWIGRAAALGRAFEMCSSEYVIVCDADDRLRPGALRSLAEEADRTGADMIIAPIVRISGGKEKILRPCGKIESLDDMPIDTVHFSLCNKLLRLETVKRGCKPFPGIDRWEDLGVIARFVAIEPKISVIDLPVYDYIRRRGVTTRSTSENNLIVSNRIAIAEKLDGWFRERGLSDKYGDFIRHIKFYAMINMARTPDRDLRRWSSVYPEVLGSVMSLRHVPLLYRLICKIVFLFYR